MSIPEIYKKLGGYKRDIAKRKLLQGLDPEDEFWVTTWWLLSTKKPPYELLVPETVFPDGDGLPEGVLGKLLKAYLGHKVFDHQMTEALLRFAQTCTQKEWSSWYRPILNRELFVPVSIEMFNEFAPDEYKLPLIRFSEPTPFGQGHIKGSLYVEPYYEDVTRTVWFAGTGRIVGFDQHGQMLDDPEMIEFLEPVRKLDGEVIFEVYRGEKQIGFRDILDAGQFRAGGATPPYRERRRILEDVFRHTLDNQNPKFHLVEALHCKSEEEHNRVARENISLIFQQGYPGVILRDSNANFFSHSDILIHPSRKSTLTCTGSATESDGRYVSRVAYLHGKGKVKNENIEARVFHGLTLGHRIRVFESQQRYEGERFIVKSCGPDGKGGLLFPVFQGWKNADLNQPEGV